MKLIPAPGQGCIKQGGEGADGAVANLVAAFDKLNGLVWRAQLLPVFVVKSSSHGRSWAKGEKKLMGLPYAF